MKQFLVTRERKRHKTILLQCQVRGFRVGGNLTLYEDTCKDRFNNRKSVVWVPPVDGQPVSAAYVISPYSYSLHYKSVAHNINRWLYGSQPRLFYRSHRRWTLGHNLMIQYIFPYSDIICCMDLSSQFFTFWVYLYIDGGNE